jgi:hypothetical protein
MSVWESVCIALSAGVASILAAFAGIGILVLLDMFLTRNDEVFEIHSCEKCKKK